LTVLAVSFVGWRMTKLLTLRAVTLNNLFTAQASRPLWAVVGEAVNGLWAGYQSPPATQHWLLLGTDAVDGSHRNVVFTDTMMLVTYQPRSHTLSLLNLPRDLYLPDVATKINALYTYGLEQQPDQPLALLTSTLNHWLGIFLDHVVVISLDDVQALIDTIGGINIDVPEAFTDPLFPRSGVDVTKEHDPKLLYESISFAAGLQHMDGTKALKYMRSRHSANLAEGTDVARNRRQQQVIAATLAALKRPEIVANANVWGKLYRWYAERFAAQISLDEVGYFLGMMSQSKKMPTLKTTILPVTNEAVATVSGTILVHPPSEKYSGQWVYELADPTGQALQDFVRDL
jgi:anionic cell wall polymer biosynthesis LytR-Cps2A-Psr (LCP) family protein